VSTTPGFDRLKPRTGSAPRADRQGKSALFSAGDPAQVLGAFGTVTVRCSACKVTTSLTPWAAMWAALPSLHLPPPLREYPSWMRCPACSRRTWVRLGLVLGG
jgi:hypothetical protein